MNVGFSAHLLDQGQTGVGGYIAGLLKALSRVDRNTHYDVYLKNAHDLPLIGDPNNFNLIPMGGLAKGAIANILWHNMALPLLSKSKNYDLVHIPTIRRIPLLKGTKVIATVHDMAPFKVSGKYDRFRQFYHHQILSRLIQRCDHIIAVSHSTKKDIIEYTSFPEEKISVIYSGIDLDVYKVIPHEEALQRLAELYTISKPFILYVSRMEYPGKNHIRLIEAFEMFKNRYRTDHELVFAGKYDAGHKKILQRVAASPFKESIKVLGFVPKDQIVDLYNCCDVMALPSLYEGMGFPLLEAMACGAPVVCSNCSSLEEIGKDYAVLFDPYNPLEMAESINQALSKSSVEKQSAIDYAKTFSWDETAVQVLSVYKNDLG